VTNRLTLDYGIRWTRRMRAMRSMSATACSPTIPNPPPAPTRRRGVRRLRSGRCNCQFARPYDFAIGPALDSPTRSIPKRDSGGWGVVYANLATFSYFTNAPSSESVSTNSPYFRHVRPSRARSAAACSTIPPPAYGDPRSGVRPTPAGGFAQLLYGSNSNRPAESTPSA